MQEVWVWDRRVYFSLDFMFDANFCVDNTFMEMACSFQNCICGVIPFKYLGLPIW
jgi:hypothetical protein